MIFIFIFLFIFFLTWPIRGSSTLDDHRSKDVKVGEGVGTWRLVVAVWIMVSLVHQRQTSGGATHLAALTIG